MWSSREFEAQLNPFLFLCALSIFAAIVPNGTKTPETIMVRYIKPVSWSGHF